MTNPDTNSLPAEEIPIPFVENDVRRFALRREEMGLTLADAFAQTRISMKNLAALEQGDFAALPPPVYAKAFIRQYAAFLAIDPQPLLAKYDAYLRSQEDPRQVRKSEDAEKPPQGFPLRKVLWPLLGVLLIAAALVFFFYTPYPKQPDHPDSQNVPPATQTEPSTPPESVAAPPTTGEPSTPAPLSETAPPAPEASQPQPIAPPAASPQVPPKPLSPPVPVANAPTSVASGAQKLILKAKETTWVGILIDGQEGQQALLQPGDVVTYTGNQFKLDIGNAGGVDVMLQGKWLPPQGKSGQVVHVTLP